MLEPAPVPDDRIERRQEAGPPARASALAVRTAAGQRYRTPSTSPLSSSPDFSSACTVSPPLPEPGRTAAQQAERRGEPRVRHRCQDARSPAAPGAAAARPATAGSPCGARRLIDPDAVPPPRDAQQPVIVQALQRPGRRLGEPAPAVHRPLAAEAVREFRRVRRRRARAQRPAPRRPARPAHASPSALSGSWRGCSRRQVSRGMKP